MLDLTALAAKVAADTTVDQAAVTLLGELSTAIATLSNGTTDPATQAALDALASQLDANAAGLAAAVTANTPAHTGAIPGQPVQPGVVPGTAGSALVGDSANAAAPAIPASVAAATVGDPTPAPAEVAAVVHPSGFVVRVLNETYNEYVQRAANAGMTNVLDVNAWNAVAAPTLTAPTLTGTVTVPATGNVNAPGNVNLVAP